jgi:hypothetical protein
MARIPLEDNFDDVINKAQRGLKISDDDLAKRAEVSAGDLAAVKSGKPIDAVIRRVARHLRLSADALEALAHKRWYPQQPIFPAGFAAFNTRYEDMTVNSYLIWDARAKVAAAFDTGATSEPMLDLLRAEKLKLQYIFLTHTHEDHIADLGRFAAETKAEVWSHEIEPADLVGAKTFKENAHFHLGPIAIAAHLRPFPRHDDLLHDGAELAAGCRRRRDLCQLHGRQRDPLHRAVSEQSEKDPHAAPRHRAGLRPRPADHARAREAAQSFLRALKPFGDRTVALSAMLHRRFLPPLFAVAATVAVLLSAGRAQGPSPGHAYFYTEPGFRGEVFALYAGTQIENLAFIQDSHGRPFNDRIRSVQLEGPIRVLMFQHADFRGASMWLNGDVPDLGAFEINFSSRGSWDRNISSAQVQSAGRDVIVFARWDRRGAERVVRASYRDILGRDADGPGLRLYTSRLVDAGWSEEQLREDLRHSDEFKNRDLDAIIRRVYRETLGREPDGSGLASYKRSLSRGMTEAEMREDLRRSREGADKQVTLAITRAYREILHREPDAAGLQSYTDLMLHQGLKESDVREALKRSDEYRNLRHD